MPKRQVIVDDGPIWNELVASYGTPFGPEPVHSGQPSFARPADVYGPWFADADFAVPEESIEDNVDGPAVAQLDDQEATS